MFEVGTRVHCSHLNLDGEVQDYNEGYSFPVYVVFDDVSVEEYTADGRILLDNEPCLTIIV